MLHLAWLKSLEKSFCIYWIEESYYKMLSLPLPRTESSSLSCSCSIKRPTEFSPPTRERWGRWWGPRWTGWSRQWSGCCRSWSSCLQRVRPSGPPVADRFVVGRRSYFDFLSDQFYQKNSWGFYRRIQGAERSVYCKSFIRVSYKLKSKLLHL